MNLKFCVFWCYLWLSSSIIIDNSGIQRVGKKVQHLTFLSHTSQKNIVNNQWFVQDLDHFNVTDNRYCYVLVYNIKLHII